MGFERCHPAVNFLYFAAVITGIISFQHPIFLAISFLCAFLYSVKRNGWKAVAFNLALLPLIGAFALYCSSYNHFGVTVLQQNFIGNNMTLEALIYGFVLGFVAAGVIIWFSCVYSVFSSDKVVYLFGRVSPRLSLFLAIALRMVPRMAYAAFHKNPKISKACDQFLTSKRPAKQNNVYNSHQITRYFTLKHPYILTKPLLHHRVRIRTAVQGHSLASSWDTPIAS